MRHVEHRVAKRDGEIVQQRRVVVYTIKSKWWNPWSHTVDCDIGEWHDVPIVTLHTIRRGDRIRVVRGFNVGAMGYVDYIDPTNKYWVVRDGAGEGNAVYYHEDEIELIWRDVKVE